MERLTGVREKVEVIGRNADEGGGGAAKSSSNVGATGFTAEGRGAEGTGGGGFARILANSSLAGV